MKKFVVFLVAFMLVASLALSVQASYTQKTGGSYSTVTPVTQRSREWILTQFGHCQTLPELLQAIDDFGCANFVYEEWAWGFIQEFNLDRFLFSWDYRGVCFDFSCFVKSVVTVWSEEKGRSDVQAFVYDVHLKNGGRHSYNFIFEDGHIWYLCLTTNVSRTTNGKTSRGFSELTEGTVKQCTDRWGDRVFNIN